MIRTRVRSSNFVVALKLTERSDTIVPRDYDDMLSYYTRNGFRVIAIAGKSVEGMTWLKAQRMKRSVCTRHHLWP